MPSINPDGPHVDITLGSGIETDQTETTENTGVVVTTTDELETLGFIAEVDQTPDVNHPTLNGPINELADDTDNYRFGDFPAPNPEIQTMDDNLKFIEAVNHLIDSEGLRELYTQKEIENSIAQLKFAKNFPELDFDMGELAELVWDSLPEEAKNIPHDPKFRRSFHNADRNGFDTALKNYIKPENGKKLSEDEMNQIIAKHFFPNSTKPLPDDLKEILQKIQTKVRTDLSFLYGNPIPEEGKELVPPVDSSHFSNELTETYDDAFLTALNAYAETHELTPEQAANLLHLHYYPDAQIPNAASLKEILKTLEDPTIQEMIATYGFNEDFAPKPGTKKYDDFLGGQVRLRYLQLLGQQTGEITSEIKAKLQKEALDEVAGKFPGWIPPDDVFELSAISQKLLTSLEIIQHLLNSLLDLLGDGDIPYADYAETAPPPEAGGPEKGESALNYLKRISQALTAAMREIAQSQIKDSDKAKEVTRGQFADIDAQLASQKEQQRIRDEMAKRMEEMQNSWWMQTLKWVALEPLWNEIAKIVPPEHRDLFKNIMSETFKWISYATLIVTTGPVGIGLVIAMEMNKPGLLFKEMGADKEAGWATSALNEAVVAMADYLVEKGLFAYSNLSEDALKKQVQAALAWTIMIVCVYVMSGNASTAKETAVTFLSDGEVIKRTVNAHYLRRAEETRSGEVDELDVQRDVMIATMATIAIIEAVFAVGAMIAGGGASLPGKVGNFFERLGNATMGPLKAFSKAFPKTAFAFRTTLEFIFLVAPQLAAQGVNIANSFTLFWKADAKEEISELEAIILLLDCLIKIRKDFGEKMFEGLSAYGEDMENIGKILEQQHKRNSQMLTSLSQAT